MLALLAYSLAALPAGGDFYVGLSAPDLSSFRLIILCRGRSARIPERASGILSGKDLEGIDSRFVLPYYVARLASEASLKLSVSKDGEDVIFAAKPA